jgi:O-antigen/teichoic acid export membrane protein
MSDAGHSLGTRTIRGMAWAYGAYVGGRMLVLVAMAILTRLLTPADFGVVALTTTFMLFLDAVRDLGLAQAVIVGDPRDGPERAQTAFVWSVLIGATLTVATILLSPAAASFFDEPDLRHLLPLMGSTFLLRSLGSTHYALARKDINYRVRTFSELSDVIVRGVVGIVLALMDAGALALVAGFVAGAATSTVVLWLQVRFRPRLRITRLHLGNMLAFGGMLTLVDIGAVLAYNLDYVFIGKILGASALGFYTIAFRLPELVVINLAAVAGDVLFPAYAIVDRERLRSAYLVALRYTAMLTLPIVAVLVVLAPALIRVLFGDQWGESASVMQILSISALLTTLTIPCGTVFKVTGKAWVLVAITLPDLVVLVILLAIFTDEGIRAVALISAALGATGLPLVTLIASRQLRLPYLANVRAILPSVLGAAVMGLAMLGADELISGALVTLLVALPVGAAVYLAGLLLFARDDLRRLQRMAFPRLADSRPAT